MHQTRLELLNSQDQYEFKKISTIKPNELIVQNVTKEKIPLHALHSFSIGILSFILRLVLFKYKTRVCMVSKSGKMPVSRNFEK